jgi:hypothetical protein
MNREPAGCLFGFLANLLGHRPASESQPPRVIVNKFFITDAERNFFHVLGHVVGTRGYILSQVSLRQLLYFPNVKGRQSWQNRAARCLDFVICHPHSLQPFLAIELDDTTHGKPERQTRDEHVETLLTTARLPFIHVLTSRTYSVAELSATILPHLPP